MIYITLQDSNYRIIEIIDLLSKGLKLSAIVITKKIQKELWLGKGGEELTENH